MDKKYEYQRLQDSISKFPNNVLCMSFIETFELLTKVTVR